MSELLKVANEAAETITRKTAGNHYFQEAMGVPEYYHDKKLLDTFAPTMTREEAQSELDYINSPVGLKAMKHQNNRTSAIFSGLAGGMVGSAVAASSGLRRGLAVGGATALGTHLLNKGLTAITPDEMLTFGRRAFLEQRLRKLREKEGQQ